MTTGPGRCHLCGAPAVPEASSVGSRRCAACEPIREHVVSMQTGAGGSSLALCQCGWRSEVRGQKRYLVQDTKVRLHWRDAIRRTRDAFDGEFGSGAAARELEGFAMLVTFALNGLMALVVIADAMSGGLS